MNIPDEQYEEMQNKITELTGLLGFIIRGMFVVISKETLIQFAKNYDGWELQTVYDKEKVQIWMDKKDEEQS